LSSVVCSSDLVLVKSVLLMAILLMMSVTQ